MKVEPPIVRIRKMDMSDIDFVYHMEMETFEKSLSKKTLYDEILYNDLAFYHVLLVDGERAGYVGCWITEPNAEILNILVMEKHRHRGYGALLMGEVLALCTAHAVEQLTLEVRPSNLSAIKFYEAFGFKRITERKNYYQDGENAVLMIKTLGGTDHDCTGCGE